ncbi:insulinase family protein [Pseudoflavitalea sp. G-6-1-2]|uniref:M16 family metallopeptidase n=1 Tax=Pseudoflavitalea sp. G-6-1-2 TaxID=2728841 RepID=UPI00146B5617|nr:M16 family metallopeptidase [Pseudoflavitalea sp. G-6-1-2]NML21864.1 insulinase family protein [Pseudoflavitalea sp. G-6-1-2]
MSILIKRRAGILVLLLLILGVVSCKDDKVSLTGLEKKILPNDSAVITGELPNGLKYYIRRNKNPENRAVFYLVNKIGSVHETNEQRGLAHFVEHMAFRGTKNFPGNNVIDFLEKAGVKFGADLNAYTSYNETVYQLPIPTQDSSLLGTGLAILKDWAQNIEITEAGVNTERGIVLAEKRQRQGLEQRIREQSLFNLLNGAKYAERAPIGIDSVLKNAKAADLQKFYQNWYRPDLQSIIAVGDFDAAEMEKKIIALFSDLKKEANGAQPEEVKIPQIEREHYQTVLDEEIANATIQVLHKYPTRDKIESELDLRNSMIASLFNTMLANRINDMRRGAEMPFLSAAIKIESLFAGLGSASVNVTVNLGEYEKGFKTIMRELRKIKEQGFNQHELDRAKASFIEKKDYQFGERNKVTSQNYVTVYVNAFLKNVPYPAAEFYNEFYNLHIRNIGLEEVQSLIEKFYNNKNRDVYVMAPSTERDQLPGIEELEKWTEEVGKEELVVQEEKKVNKKLMNELPKGGSIVSETTNQEMGITTWQLSNGAKVILKPTTFRNDQILISAFSPGGSSLYPDKDYQSAIDAVGILSRGGVGELDAKTLSRVLTGRTMTVNPFISENYEGVNASSSKKDLESAFQLMHLYFTQPRLDKELVAGILKEAKDRAQKRYSKPANVFADTINAVMFNHHFRKRAVQAERVDMINADTALKIYKERFADFSDFTFVLVGSLDLNTLKPMVQQYLASLPGLNRNEGTKYIQYTYPEGGFTKLIQKGKTDKSTVTMILDGTYQEEPNLAGNMTALRDIVQLKMTERLRGTEHEVYSPGISMSMLENSKRYELRIGFTCSPGMVEKLTMAAKDELNKLVTNGASAGELTKFKAEFAKSMEVQLKRNEYWLSQICAKLQVGKDLQEITEVASKMEAVTAQSFKETAKKYLHTNSLKIFVLSPESGQ